MNNQQKIKLYLDKIERALKTMQIENFDYWNFKNNKEIAQFNINYIIELGEYFNKLKKVLANEQ